MMIQKLEEVTVRTAMDRLNLTKEGVIYLIKQKKLTARLADAPTPYYLIIVDDKFRAKQKARSQSAN